jgi:hypothetical protein
VKQLAMLRINPPAGALMLSEYVDLKPGDWWFRTLPIQVLAAP